MLEGFDGLLRDKTRPSRVKPLGPEVAERVVELTPSEPPGETTHWTDFLMAKATGLSVSSVRRIWRAMGCGQTGCASSSFPAIRASPRNCATSSGSTSTRPSTPYPRLFETWPGTASIGTSSIFWMTTIGCGSVIEPSNKRFPSIATSVSSLVKLNPMEIVPRSSSNANGPCSSLIRSAWSAIPNHSQAEYPISSHARIRGDNPVRWRLSFFVKGYRRKADTREWPASARQNLD